MNIDDPRAFLQLLDGKSLWKVAEACRKIAGPWEQNPYTNRQWQRKLYPNAFAPSHGVSLGNKGLYYVHSTFLVHPELWTTLEDAKKHSDALMSADGWTLSDDFVIRSR